MLPLLDLLRLIFSALGDGLVGWLRNPGMLYFPIMISIVMSLVLRQYLRQASLEEHLFGTPLSRPLRQVMTSLGFGALGGFFASLLMASLGIALSEEMGIIYVWPVDLVMMLVNPRFMCFAYGGGVVGAVSLLLRGLALLWPQLSNVGLVAGLMAVDLPALMGLVGLLHLTEALLIFVSGHLNASPIIVQGPEGKLVGGFMLQRFWPMPMAALFALIISPTELGEGAVSMPNWWPLIRPLLEPGPGMILTMTLLPIVAALGYSDIAVSSTPRAKSRWSARNLLLYSIILLVMAILSGRWTPLQVVAVLFAPLGHEFLIQAGNRREWAGEPLYTAPERGVRLLTVLPDSAAEAQGLGGGWIILNVNGIDVNSRRDLTFALNTFPGLAEIEAVSPGGETRTVRIHQRQGKLGLVPVPDPSQGGNYLQLGSQGFLLRLWKRIKKKQSGA
jgi:hypothetical protein